MSSGAGSEIVDAALQLLIDSKPARVLLAQVRQPLSDKNGRDIQGYGGRKHVDDMTVSPAKLCQEVSESRNTIYQLRKGTQPNERQRQNNWQAGRRGQDPPQAEQPAPRTGVQGPEGAAKGAKGPQKSPAKAQANMLRTSRRSSDSDEDFMHERACLVRVRKEIDKTEEAMEPSLVH